MADNERIYTPQERANYQLDIIGIILEAHSLAVECARPYSEDPPEVDWGWQLRVTEMKLRQRHRYLQATWVRELAIRMHKAVTHRRVIVELLRESETPDALPHE